jgi:hypothetical protein
MKEQNLFDVITRDTTSPSIYSIYILQCSTPYENVLKNRDLSAQTYEGKNRVYRSRHFQIVFKKLIFFKFGNLDYKTV